MPMFPRSFTFVHRHTSYFQSFHVHSRHNYFVMNNGYDDDVLGKGGAVGMPESLGKLQRAAF